jgi:hypothetical protein
MVGAWEKGNVVRKWQKGYGVYRPGMVNAPPDHNLGAIRVHTLSHLCLCVSPLGGAYFGYLTGPASRGLGVLSVLRRGSR